MCPITMHDDLIKESGRIVRWAWNSCHLRVRSVIETCLAGSSATTIERLPDHHSPENQFLNHTVASTDFGEHLLIKPKTEYRLGDDILSVITIILSCPIGAYGAGNAPALISVNAAVSHILERLNASPALPNYPLTTRERNIIIRARHVAGASQAELARQFGISYQRVHQIVHGKRK